MPYKNVEDRRAFERTRDRHEYHAAYMVGWRRRRRAKRAALKVVPPGRSAALDHLRERLKGTHGPERQRLQAAIDRIVALHTGGKVKATSGSNGAALRVRLAPIDKWNMRPTPAAADPDDLKPTGRAEVVWMDGRLSPETA